MYKRKETVNYASRVSPCSKSCYGICVLFRPFLKTLRFFPDLRRCIAIVLAILLPAQDRTDPRLSLFIMCTIHLTGFQLLCYYYSAYIR